MFELPKGRPALMGILNVTPDSFSDGGRYTQPDLAVARALQMIEEGADLIDVGGESTRPGAKAVPVDEEISRVLPVVSELCRKGVSVSIDTRKAGVAAAALAEGACVVNDVSALQDPRMAETCATSDCTVCLMHMRGDPETMQQETDYADVVLEVEQTLLDRAAYAESQGIARGRIWIDPGIGFGKDANGNLSLIAAVPRLASHGYPLLVGASRKSFLGRVLGENGKIAPIEDRFEATLAVHVLSQWLGASVLRVHDVRAAKRCAETVAAIARL